MQTPDENWWTDEEGYPEYLEVERHLFAWCLVRLGNVAENDAKNEALKRYPYEPPDQPYRGIIFHGEAWRWAMIHLFGDDHEQESIHYDASFRAEYERESLRWETENRRRPDGE